MGKLHAEKVASMQAGGARVELVGIADIDPHRARELGAKVGARAVSHVRELLGDLDAAIVAVPTLSHFEVVKELLVAGVDVLVEKPIAATLAEAEELLALARAGERMLQVGHLEWYNTAMHVIRERVLGPRFIEAQRVGPFPDRATDIDVVRDLMIHDLDILQQLLGAEPERIEAVGIAVVTENVDIANARITYPCGCIASLTASRVSMAPMRRIRFFQRDGYLSIDFLDRSAALFRRDAGGNGAPPRLRMHPLEVERGDPLLTQLAAFLRAVRTREKPAVDGAGGLDALRSALRVIDAMPDLDHLE